MKYKMSYKMLIFCSFLERLIDVMFQYESECSMGFQMKHDDEHLKQLLRLCNFPLCKWYVIKVIVRYSYDCYLST